LAISKERKTELVEDYVDKVNRSQGMILADYRGLTVAAMTDLRQRLREVDGAFQVVKNTLFKRALQEAGIPVPEEHLRGPVAVGFCFRDPPPVAKVLVDFAKETQILEIQGALLGARFIDKDAAKDLADLPSRDVLLAQLLGAVQGPMSSLVSTITAPLRELVQVLQARSEQGADEPSPMEAAA
jgi:large subunit ribosomal protein L10